MVQMQSNRLFELIGGGSRHSDNHSQTQIVDGRFSGLQDDRFIQLRLAARTCAINVSAL